eukprot:TRINITY_DN7104_c0_g1_i1.p2 TRINITY_DN7104_c0_g1~~TRINITY_DN7104_c0_g1_i1.p2  ORF type:complete len:111 (+),score=13.07 TRINITY_DN7104_c0_g1_i1:101-433(+)
MRRAMWMLAIVTVAAQHTRRGSPGEEPPAPPTETCSAMTLHHNECPAGTILASSDNVALCLEELCSRIDAWEMVGFGEPNVAVFGSAYVDHCSMQSFAGLIHDVVCVPQA